MGLKKILIGAASAMVLTAGAANAGYERDGWYFGVEAGYGRVSDTDLGASALTFSDGMAAMGTAGYAFKNSNWRMEGEIGYRSNDLDTVAAQRASQGDLIEWSGMVNAIYDFHLNSDKWGIGIGGGIGIDNARLTAPSGYERDDKVFAFQGIAGVTYRINQHWDLAINYRYFNAAQAELSLSSTAPLTEVDLEKHSITIGVRFGYDEPPAPVAPPVAEPVAPPAPKQFIVFFGYNKCNITAEADAVLSEAAAAAKSGGSASVRIVGHTDTSGSNAYNQKLSECRANAAKTNLVGKGVSEGSISASGKGEAELMVQTGDGVKEPQNRRATIDLN
jgi:OOP family OmpA-OmpF porin